MSPAERLLDSRLAELLDRVADDSASPASGAGTAVVVAMAAGMVAMAARRSRGEWEQAGAAAAQAGALRDRAAALVQESADAYERAVARLEVGGDPSERPEQRDWQLGTALHRAAVAPMSVAEVAADVCELAAETAAHCAESSRPDAVAGCLLADAGARIGAHLIEVNLGTREDDELGGSVKAAVGRCNAARASVLA